MNTKTFQSVAEQIKSGNIMSKAHLDKFYNIKHLVDCICEDGMHCDEMLKAQIERALSRKNWGKGTLESVVSKAFTRADKFYLARLENLSLKRKTLKKSLEVVSTRDFIAKNKELTIELQSANDTYQKKMSEFKTALDSSGMTLYKLKHNTKESSIPQYISVMWDDLTNIINETQQLSDALKNRKENKDKLEVLLLNIEKSISDQLKL